MSEKFDNLGRREFIKRGLIGSTLLAGELTNGFGLVRGFLEDLFADEAKENWDHKFEIPENHIKEVRDFFTFLDQPISNLDIKKATELLNKFRTDWDVSISNPLGPKDSNKDLILLSGPEEGWNLATGKKLTDRERKFFLKKENPQSNIWLAYTTYYNQIEKFRSLGRKDLRIDLNQKNVQTNWCSSAYALFPFLREEKPSKSQEKEEDVKFKYWDEKGKGDMEKWK
ncbi:MAG: hypothetical protein UR27_C0013G0001 [Candidatus Peregrinibacteria bacterium GW2011_GWA2_33_10]|nr:MAG: hypothetical protein UR27_C0013G0001 [Candidatus Peregrinibacteria bacterium GW2011_GWA2_33_10]KKP39133.1 MAG: hypothetical protein UR30_C0012G0006 [Candidatus Peregrinibacteria bacterium GW2011_GWC2_33_13]